MSKRPQDPVAHAESAGQSISRFASAREVSSSHSRSRHGAPGNQGCRVDRTLFREPENRLADDSRIQCEPGAQRSDLVAAEEGREFVGSTRAAELLE